MLSALPPEGEAEHFELREALVARIGASREIRDRQTRRAERRAATQDFERAERELFRRYGLS